MSLEKLSQFEAQKADAYIEANYRDHFGLFEVKDLMRIDEERSGTRNTVYRWVEKAVSLAESEGITKEDEEYGLQAVLKAIREFESDPIRSNHGRKEPFLSTSRHIEILAIGETTTIRNAIKEDKSGLAIAHAKSLGDLLGFYQSLR